MNNMVYTFQLTIDWELIRLISQIDRFDASWSTIEKKEGQSLKQLKSIATIRSVGASTRIEGSEMSDEEVDVLLKNIDITKLVDRDSQEVVGYFNAMDRISEAYQDIQKQLMRKLENKGVKARLSPKEKSILTYIENHAGCKSGEIAKKLGIPSPTVKRILTEFTVKNLIEKYGQGPGTNYSIK